MKQLSTIAMFFIGSIFYLYGAIPVDVIELKKITPAKTYYTGEIEAIEKGIFSFDIDGKIEYVVNEGDYVFEGIYDKKSGKVIRKGTIVASYDKSRQKFALKDAVMSKKLAEANLEKAEANFTRYKSLVGKKIVSSKEFLDISTSYMKAKIELNNAENKLDKAIYDIESCNITAPFSGVVTKVFEQGKSHVGAGDDIVEITKMTTLVVKIPFPRELISNFREGTKVDIYPVNGGKPVSAWCRTGLTGNMLYAYIKNNVIGQDLVDKDRKYKKIYEIFPVTNTGQSCRIVSELANAQTVFEDGKNPLAVPEKSIHKDKNGYFVLKAESAGNNENFSLFNLKRINIVPGGIERDFNLGAYRDVKIKSLSDSGSLKLNDILVFIGEKNIKDGDTAVLDNVRWKFAPNQLVKVSIPSLNEAGIYVPPKAIIHQSDNDNYVYTVNKGKAKLTKISLLGRSSGFNRISGEGIVPGAKIIAFNNPNDIYSLYDNAVVNIKKTLPHPLRIQNKRADRLLIGVPEIEKTYY
jgi:multidrug efflux pump subunit AcrA (membrane-fusion protein)